MKVTASTATVHHRLGRLGAAVAAVAAALMLLAGMQAKDASAAFVANPTTPSNPSTLTVTGGYLRVGDTIDEGLDAIDPAPVFTGTIAADGTINVPKESINFGELEFPVDTDVPILGNISGVLGIEILPQQDITGTIDPITGEATMDIWLRIRAYRISGSSLLDVGNACYLGGAGVNAIHVALSTATGPDPASTNSTGGIPYDLGTGSARFASQGFAVPGQSGCSGLAAGQINGLLGIPSSNTGAEFEINFDPKPISSADIDITDQPDALTNSTSAHFAFTSNVPSGIDYECRIDGGSWSSCNSMEADYSSLSDGSHTFEVRAVAAGMTLGDDSYTWTVDTVDPEYPLTGNRSGLVNVRTAEIKYSVSKNVPSGSTVCKLDGNPYTPCPDPPLTSSGSTATVNLTGLADGNHTFQVSGHDQVGNTGQSVVINWEVDATKPVVTIDSGPVGVVADENVDFEFTATDNRDASPQVQCQVRNMKQNLPEGAVVQPWTNCSSPYHQVRGTGTWKLQVRASDQAGNVSDVAEYTWDVKTDKPDIVDATFSGPGQGVNGTTSIDEDGGTTSGDATFEFEAVDADELPLVAGTDVTFECWLDGDPLGACESPMTLFDLTGGTPMAAGAHVFEAQPTTTTLPPIVGEKKAYAWVVDAVNPTASFSSTPATHYNQSEADFGLAINGTGSTGTAQCRLVGPATEVDAGPERSWKDCDSNTVHSLDLADGTYTLYLRAVDQAGNLSQPVSSTWTIDTVDPDAGIEATPDANSPSADAHFGFVTNDNDNQVQALCRLDSNPEVPCDSRTGHAWENVPDGQHTFTLTAVDRAGNSVSDSHTWRVDTTAPAVTITGGPSALTNQTSAAFRFNASDGGSGIDLMQCRVDDGTWITGSDCQNGNVWNYLPGPYSSASHTLQVKVTDKAGNSTTKDWTWKIDTDPAAVAIQTDINETYSDQAAIEFISPDAGAQFQCKLDAGDWYACSSPEQLSGLSVGNHVFSVRTVDQANNVSDDDSISWKVLAVPEQAPSHQLSVNREGTGGGTVTSFPEGIDCGINCTVELTENTPVTLTATADADSTFTGWSGACTGTGLCQVTMSEALTVTAEFTRKGVEPGPGGCPDGEIGTPPNCVAPLPPIKKPTNAISTYDPKTGKLAIRLKCGPQYKPRCQGTAVAVTRKGKKGKVMSSKVKLGIKAGKWKLTTLTIRKPYRDKVAKMSTVDRKQLIIRQNLKKVRKGKKRVKKTVYHTYKVRVKG